MDFASELAPFSPSAELLFWAEHRIGGRLEQAKTKATEIHWREAKIEKLTRELADLRRMTFGLKSESLAAGTRDLFDETLAANLAACEARLTEKRQADEMGPPQPPAEKPKRERAGRQPLPEPLPPCRAPAGARNLHLWVMWPGTGADRRGRDRETRIVPAESEFFVERHIYPKYACRPGKTLTAAPAVASVIEGGLAAPALLAWVTVSKSADHLPLYRLKRQGARARVIPASFSLSPISEPAGCSREDDTVPFDVGRLGWAHRCRPGAALAAPRRVAPPEDGVACR